MAVEMDMEETGSAMDDTTRTPEPTIANADLWASYFEREWGRWLSPLGAREVAEGAGARMAGFISLVAAGPIAWLYNSNYPQAQAAVAERPAEREKTPVALADRREERKEEPAA
jgi:hypothetical protein